MHVVHARMPDGERDFVTLLAPETVFSKGLAPEAIVGLLLRPPETGGKISSDAFAPNPAFVDFMHSVIALESPKDPRLREEADHIGNGVVFVIDQRTATPDGDVPSEDIIGGFEVKGGELVAGSYTPNANYEILSERGFFQLDARVLGCLVQELEELCGRG